MSVGESDPEPGTARTPSTRQADSAAGGAVAPAARVRAFLDTSARLVLGHDVFVSYRWKSGSPYATALARELEAAGLSCFIDVKELRAGEKLSPFLARVVRRSTAFVLVATNDVHESTWVPQELTAFLATGRKVIPVAGDATLAMLGARDDAPWAGLRGLRVVPENSAALAAGAPSSDTVRDIVAEFAYRRKRTVVAATYLMVLATLLSLGAAALFLGHTVAARVTELQARDHDLDMRRREIDATVMALAATRESTSPAHLDRAARTALESMTVARTPEAEAVLRSALVRLPRLLGSVSAPVERPEFMAERSFFALSSDGRWLATTECEGAGDGCNIVVRDLPTAAPRGQPIPVEGFFQGLWLTDDGEYLVVQDQVESSSRLSVYATATPEAGPASVIPLTGNERVIRGVAGFALLDGRTWRAWSSLTEAAPSASGTATSMVAATASAMGHFVFASWGGSTARVDVVEAVSDRRVASCNVELESEPELVAISEDLSMVAVAAGREVQAIDVTSCTKVDGLGAEGDVVGLRFLTDRRLLVRDRSRADLYDLAQEGVNLFATARSFGVSGHRMGALVVDAPRGLLAAAFSDGTARVFRVQDGREIATIPTAENSIVGMAFAGDGRLYTYSLRAERRGSRDGTVMVWELPSTGSSVMTDPTFAPIVRSAAAGHSIVVMVRFRSGAPFLVVWSEAGERLAELPLEHAFMPEVTVSGDGMTILVHEGRGARFYRWEAAARALTPRDSMTLPSELFALAISANGACVVMATREALSLRRADGHVVDLEVPPRAHWHHEMPDDAWYVGLAINDDCSRVAVSATVGGDGPGIAVIEPVSAGVTRTPIDDDATALGFLPDGRLIAGTAGGLVTVAPEAQDGSSINVGRHDDVVTALALTRNGRQVAVVSADHSLRVWDTAVSLDRAARDGLVALPGVEYGIAGYQALGPKCFSFTSNDRELLVVDVDVSGTSITRWPFYDTDGLLARAREILGESP